LKSILTWVGGFLTVIVLWAVMFGKTTANGAMRGPAMACFSNLKNLDVAVEEYRDEHEGAYPSRLEDFVETQPRCPRAESETTSYQYIVSPNGDDCEFRCTADHSHWYFWSDDLNYSPQRFRHFSSVGRLSLQEPPEWAEPVVKPLKAD
jgi:hypothetical protein